MVFLYPAGPMDADYDDSDIYTLGYTIRDLGAFKTARFRLLLL